MDSEREELKIYPMAIKEWPEDDRPREKLLRHGAGSLTDAELLAIILRTGSMEGNAVDFAKAIMSRYGDFASLDMASCRELCAIKGIGIAKVTQIKAALEIGKRQKSVKFENGDIFTSSIAVYNHFYESFRGKRKEIFIAVLLDVRNRKVRDVLVSEGCLTSTIVHPREVFNPAIKDSAASIIFVHNHPSGDPVPSNEDRELTSRLKNAGDLLGIKVLDHIIIGDGRYTSFADEGLL